jgi:hypothetical protein
MILRRCTMRPVHRPRFRTIHVPPAAGAAVIRVAVGAATAPAAVAAVIRVAVGAAQAPAVETAPASRCCLMVGAKFAPSIGSAEKDSATACPHGPIKSSWSASHAVRDLGAAHPMRLLTADRRAAKK